MGHNLLITGAGGNLAHFIFRAAQRATIPIEIFAADYHWDAVGLYQAKKGYVVPPAKSETYVPAIIRICQENRIHLICAGGMVEMRKLAENKEKIRDESGAIVLSSGLRELEVAEDKWRLADTLKGKGFDAPASCLPGNEEAWAAFRSHNRYPFIVKDRFGGGSQNLGVARNDAELQSLLRKVPNPVVQEYLFPDDQEYTVGVFADATGRVRGCIAMKRALGLGMTFKAEVLLHSEIGAYAETIVGALNLRGPINVQLRLTERGPVIFEINPRFSSTTSARALFGFNEVEMAVRSFCLHEELPRPAITPGHLYRVIEDVVVPSEIVERTRETGIAEGVCADIPRW